MLNVNEIRDLEERWKRYNRKKYLKVFFYLIIFIVIILFIYLFGFDSSVKLAIGDINISKKSSKNVIEKQTIQKYTNKKVTPKKRVVKTDKKIKVLEKTFKKKMPFSLKKKKLVKTGIAKSNNIENKVPILKLNTNFLNHIYKKEANDIGINLIDNNNATINTNNNTVKSDMSKQDRVINKPKILISSKKIDKIRYLKNRYKESKKALYAVLLSKEYYKKKIYKNSLYWAQIANNLDSSNEDSWILFAKNKVKLGKKNDAINVLSAYLKVNSSKKIQILLSDIKNGVFK